VKVRVLAGMAAAAMVVAGALTGGPARAADAPYPVGYDFLENTVRVGAAESAPGENDWSCRPSAAHPEPVVLVHGTGGNAATNWATYAALLANHGYCVYALTYGLTPLTASLPVKLGGLGDIRRSAAELGDFVARVLASTGARKVDLVGHSQGTLMPDYWVKVLGGAAYVDQYISLSPLWHGEGPDALGALMRLAATHGFPTSLPLCPACSQMANGSEFVEQLRSGPDGVAVAGVDYTNIVTRLDDVVVPYTSGIETGHPNMRNVVLQQVCPLDLSDHLEIASSPNAAQVVLNLLDPTHATPVRCRLTLPVNGFVLGR
jgi:triacylglycerol lipase